uniref:ATP synthase subunit a n=1 Tax=Bovichtus argentinus TaxID=215379 RepID=A0A1V1FV21_9TELE|nr:ATP synthase F0 subunit 6 [Bovichtus argentinus]BAX09142.1 ATPase subunit 6 [Bovichtus argentinus]
MVVTLTLDMFDQFFPPLFLGVPLMIPALAFPWLLLPSPSGRWLTSRLLTAQSWFIFSFTKQIFSPLNFGGHKWALLLTSLMVYLISLNMLGLLPYTFTPTTQLALNLGIAIPLWLGTVLIGLRNQPTHALGHLLPEGTPTPLIPILVIIETISLLVRPLALGVRLTANLTAGHLLIQLIATGTFLMLSLMPPVALLTGTLLVLLSLLEIAVAAIQAYVFVLLLSLYLQENI